ncbi:MAG TPA: hypothetical protein VML50_07185 [Anaeromyxobacter sp.]|nr:hypothetical protein [Anaeromyxobacter sp.]
MRFALVIVLVMAGVGCATATAGAPVPQSSPLLGGGDGNLQDLSGLSGTAQFDYGCPPKKVLLIRCGPSACDLDVCGSVHRYMAFHGINSVNWLDVTSMYPASSLPPPLPK